MTEVSVVKKNRMVNLELLRMVSMMLIVVLHYLGKGDLLPVLGDKTLSWGAYYPWFFEALAIVAVNVYMLLTGFFVASASFKVSRLVKVVLQVWFYAVVVGAIAGAFGLFPDEGLCIHYILCLIFPVSMNHYWFMTAYVFMYVLTPFIAAGARMLTKRQLQIVTAALLIIFSVVKSLVPARLDGDMMGYDSMWYLCICVLAVYIRQYGIPFVNTVKKGLLVWIVSAGAIFAVTLCLRFVYVQTDLLGTVLNMCYDYNHVLNLAASLGIFCAFYRMKGPGGRIGKWILKISPYTLGVYLLHEHLALRYQWQNWLGAEQAKGSSLLIFWVVAAVCAVFTLGILADVLRHILFSGIHKILYFLPPYRKLVAAIQGIDEQMQERSERNKSEC